MMYEPGMNSNVQFDSNVTGNNNIVENDMNVDINMMSSNSINQNMMGGCSEPVQEKCIHRTFVHEVPHVCPIHTRIINHHVYKHTYSPKYTCSEENTVSNIQCGSCCQYR